MRQGIAAVLIALGAILGLACGGPDPTNTPSSELSPTVMPTTAAARIATLIPTATLVPTATSAPLPTVTPIPTAIPAPTNTPRPTPTPTSTPTPSPVPTAAPFDGVYTLLVDQGDASFVGKTVTFQIENLEASETSRWESGDITQLNLTAFSGQTRNSGSPEGDYSGETLKGSLLASPISQRLPPHIFTGTAKIDGKAVPKGTTISAWVDGVLVEESTVTEKRLPDALSATAEVVSSLGSNLSIIWRFSNTLQVWTVYVPGTQFSWVNTYTDASSGDIVWLNVDNDQVFQGQQLYAGWNLILLD